VIENAFYVAMQRFFLHSESLVTICENENIPKAWAVVSIYYSSFFSSMILLNMAGIWPIFLSQQDAATINTAGGSRAEMTAGLYLFRAYPLGSTFYFIATRVDGGGGTHALVWSQIRDLLSVEDDKVRSQDGDSFRRLKKVVSSDWGVPSEVRNNWNYRCPDYYGSQGKAIVAKAKFNQDWLFGWVKKNILHPAEVDQVVGLYYLQHYFGDVLLRASPLILPSPMKGRLSKLASNRKLM